MSVIWAAEAGGVVLIELGALILVLAVLGRIAGRLSVPSIPLYLVAGLLLGEGSIVSLDASAEFTKVAADVGVVLLLLLLGLEYTPAELHSGLRRNWAAGVIDLLANFVPGCVGGLVLGWSATAAFLLGGITYVSSSGIIAKLVSDLHRIGNRETPTVLSLLVMEDIAMAVFLPITGVVLAGAHPVQGMLSVAIAVVIVAGALVASVRYGSRLSGLLHSHSREVLLLTVLGLTLFIAGLAEEVQVSAAVGAFLVGVTLSGQIAEEGHELLAPIRDVFGGLFFIFFGLQIDPTTLPPAVVPAVLLAVVTGATKIGTGWWAAARVGIGQRGRMRAGVSLIPRGELSIVIAGVGVAAGVEDELGPLAACYVLILAVVGSLVIRFADVIPLRLPPSASEATG